MVLQFPLMSGCWSGESVNSLTKRHLRLQVRAWARSSDFDANSEVTSGAFVFVEQGTVAADQGFVLTTDGTITVGTTSLSFTQFSGAGAITAGDGLQKSGKQSLLTSRPMAVWSLNGELALKLDASSITGTLAIGDGGTGATSASAARTALGVAIGSDVQAFDQGLADIAGLACHRRGHHRWRRQ